MSEAVHLLTPSGHQCGSIPKVSLTLVLSSTEYAGRTTLLGNSPLWQGSIRHESFPANAATAFAKSYQLHTPSSEKLYIPDL